MMRVAKHAMQVGMHVLLCTSVSQQGLAARPPDGMAWWLAVGYRKA